MLSHRLCAAIRWPLTRARAGLMNQGYPLRLPCGAMWASRPTQNWELVFVGATLAVARMPGKECLPIAVRRGRCLHRPAGAYTAVRVNHRVIAKPVRTLAVGIDPSAAGGGRSEVSEWLRSKFQASAVRRRRNFGHRNRGIRTPYAPHPLLCASGGVLSANSGRKYPKNAVKTKVLKSFRAWGAVYVENLLPREPGAQVYRHAFASSLRRHPLAAHAGPRWPDESGIPSAPTVRRDVGIAPYTKLGTCFRRGDPRGRPNTGQGMSTDSRA